jgi:hypothetical protein
VSSFFNGIISKAGKYLTALGNDSMGVMDSITYQRWLVLSALAVVVGYFLLRTKPIA